MENSLSLKNHTRLIVSQRTELAELFGFETRNKYEIRDENGIQIGFAAEQEKNFLAHISRYFFGHWRSFTFTIFDEQRRPVLMARHPFRFFFQRLEVFEMNGPFVGAVQQRWSILHKRFDVENASGTAVMTVASPFWRIWTFPFMRYGRQIACVTKKWSGVLHELITDKDNFAVEFNDPTLGEAERKLVLAASLFIDLQYFERKAGSRHRGFNVDPF
jgi:uncharacterized protein YxjI